MRNMDICNALAKKNKKKNKTHCLHVFAKSTAVFCFGVCQGLFLQWMQTSTEPSWEFCCLCCYCNISNRKRSLKKVFFQLGRHGGAVFTLQPHSEEVVSLILGPFCVYSACSPCVYVGFLVVLQPPSTVENSACKVKWELQMSAGEQMVVCFYVTLRWNCRLPSVNLLSHYGS